MATRMALLSDLALVWQIRLPLDPLMVTANSLAAPVNGMANMQLLNRTVYLGNIHESIWKASTSRCVSTFLAFDF